MFLQIPDNEVEWRKISEEFSVKWNFYNCIGAMDGKHIVIRPPPNSGSYYFNYKGTFSLVLLAVVDADYNLVYVDVGCNGRISDGGVFRNCSLYTAMERNCLNTPEAEPLPGRSMPVPFAFVADDAFPLKNYIQKPYSMRTLTKEKRIFNYRLSRARRVVENAFGILANRFRIFMQPIHLHPEKVEAIVLACICLHNFLRSRSTARNIYTPPGSFDEEATATGTTTPGEWRQSQTPQGMIRFPQQAHGRGLDSAKSIRDELCSFYCSKDGEVPWQWKIA